jgi:Family of unknown function (DUF6409)
MKNAVTVPGPVGNIVIARPWHRGAELAQQYGFVLDEWNGDPDYLLVWFSELGLIGSVPTGDDRAQPVQAILACKTTPAGSVHQFANHCDGRNRLMGLYAYVTGHQEAAQLHELLRDLIGGFVA